MLVHRYALDDVGDHDVEGCEYALHAEEIGAVGSVGLWWVAERGREQFALAVWSAQGDYGVDVHGVEGCDDGVGCLAFFGRHCVGRVWVLGFLLVEFEEGRVLGMEDWQDVLIGFMC